MARSVLVLQHGPWAAPGRIAEALVRAGVPSERRTLIGQIAPSVPDLDALAGVVIMGGPMGADDLAEHPALAVERDLARRAVEADIPVLGVCLGHQILARALGGALHPGATREVGLGPVELVADSALGAAGSSLDVLHWHYDNAEAPPGATVLARTAECGNQAFRLGSAFATQFHLEVGPELLDAWLAIEQMSAEFPDAGAALREQLRPSDERMRPVADAVFDDFAGAALARG
jgi:GMP synthase (glutamine-hydrolysing)